MVFFVTHGVGSHQCDKRQIVGEITEIYGHLAKLFNRLDEKTMINAFFQGGESLKAGISLVLIYN